MEVVTHAHASMKKTKIVLCFDVRMMNCTTWHGLLDYLRVLAPAHVCPRLSRHVEAGEVAEAKHDAAL